MTYTTQYIVMFADHHNDSTMLSTLGVDLKTRHNTKTRRHTPPPSPSHLIVRICRSQGPSMCRFGASHVSEASRYR